MVITQDGVPTLEIGTKKGSSYTTRNRMVVTVDVVDLKAVAISGSGSVLGLLLGAGAAFAITAAMRASLHAPVYASLSVSTVVVAALSALVVGLSFGTYPALRAARMSPIDAIRHE